MRGDIDPVHRRDQRPQQSDTSTRPDASTDLQAKICDALAHLWATGWQPRDLVHHLRGFKDAELAKLVVAAIAVESRSYIDGAHIDPRWRAQLVDIGALDDRGPTASALRVEPAAHSARLVLGVLRVLQPLPFAGDPPSAWGTSAAHVATSGSSSASEAVVSKVRGLLAKAESTEFPEEAEAFTAKAQELISRHAIDRVALQAASGNAVREAPILRRVLLEEPYVEAKLHLLSLVAHANRCQTVSSGGGMATVLGFADDVDSVELLFSSLLVQATRTLAAIAAAAAPGAPQRRKAYRRAFLHGFASQIGHRLHAATEQETKAAEARHGTSLVPMLARRHDEITAARDAAFPALRNARRQRRMRTITVSDEAGWIAGNAAGARASLSLDAVVPPLRQ